MLEDKPKASKNDQIGEPRAPFSSFQSRFERPPSIMLQANVNANLNNNLRFASPLRTAGEWKSFFPLSNYGVKFSPVRSSTEGETTNSLYYYPKNCKIPQHFRENDEVTLDIISCGNECKMGPSEILLENVEIGQKLKFLPSQPNAIEVGPDLPLIVMAAVKPRNGARKSNEPGLEFADHALGRTYMMMDGGINVGEYYDGFVASYEGAMRGIGWYMPEKLAEVLAINFNVGSKTGVIADLACGSGLFGKALHARGVETIIGIDISKQMLKSAVATGLYANGSCVADLMEPLKFEDETFDVLACLGATGAFLKPECLMDWLRVTKKGGLIAYNTSSPFLPEWEKMHLKLEIEGFWKSEFKSEEMLPFCSSILGQDGRLSSLFGHIFVFRKL